MNRLNTLLNWSVRVGKLFDIPISLHISILFFLIPALTGRGDDAPHSLEYALLVVISILIHELGHALMAKRYKLRDLSIMLHGFGGFASSSGERDWKQSLNITLAGPAVTLLLGIVCTVIGLAGPKNPATSPELFHQFWIIDSIGQLNIFLAIVNMIPVLPWDGGNALRAILNRKMTYLKALRASAHVGLVIAGAMLIYCLVAKQNFLSIFAIVGVITCFGTLQQSGGINFGEVLADRKNRQELEAQSKREKARKEAYIDEVRDRERDRSEKERLRKMFEVVDGDEKD